MATNPKEEHERLRLLAERARAAVAGAMYSGRIPHVKTLLCQRCNGQAEEYHHHLGYDESHWLDVIPYCVPCHRKADQEEAVKCKLEGCNRRVYKGYDYCFRHYEDPTMLSAVLLVRLPDDLVEGMKKRNPLVQKSVVIRRLIEMFVNDEIKLDS